MRWLHTRYTFPVTFVTHCVCGCLLVTLRLRLNVRLRLRYGLRLLVDYWIPVTLVTFWLPFAPLGFDLVVRFTGLLRLRLRFTLRLPVLLHVHPGLPITRLLRVCSVEHVDTARCRSPPHLRGSPSWIVGYGLPAAAFIHTLLRLLLPVTQLRVCCWLPRCVRLPHSFALHVTHARVYGLPLPVMYVAGLRFFARFV